MEKRTVYMIQNGEGKYAEFNMAGEARWCSDPAFGFKYKSEMVAEDIARRFGGKVVPVQIPLSDE